MGIKLIYTNDNGNSIELSKDSELRVTSLDGLSSNTVSLSEATVNNQVGASVIGQSISAKDLTIEGRYKYDPSKRKRMLAVVLPGVAATLRLINTKEDLDVYWRVWPTKTPTISNGVTYQSYQIALRAPYPYARGTQSNITEFNTLTALHRFKRSYSSKTAFKLSSREYRPLQEIYNDGSLDTGFICMMEAEADEIKAPKITRVDTQENISFPNLTLNSGDVLEISTYENERYCRLTSGTETTNVFSYMDYSSNFFQLKPGNNVVRYSATSNESSLSVSLTFDNTVAGV